MVGKVIGKGGSSIREMQDQSGAHVDVAKQTQLGQNHREVTISGGPAQVAYCNLLLQGKLCENDTTAPAYQDAYQHYSRVYAQTQGAPAGGGYGAAPAQSAYGAAPQGYGAQGYGAAAG
jgi:far upstream element-binding protein